MPRTPLKTLLRDLKAFNVVRYRKTKDELELVFSGAPPAMSADPERVPEGEERHLIKGDEKRVDPLALGMREFEPIEGEDEDTEGPN